MGFVKSKIYFKSKIKKENKNENNNNTRQTY